MDIQLRRLSWPRLALAGLAFALMAWTLGSAWLLMARYTAPVPFGDQWDTAYFPGPLNDLFSQHNEHRLALVRLVGLADWALGGTNRVNTLFIALCLPLFGLTLYRLARRAGTERLAAAAMAALGVALVASVAQWENLLWGFQTSFEASFVLALAALAAAGERGLTAFAICLLASAGSVFSLSSGLLVLPAVIALLFATGAPRGVQLAYLAFVVAVAAAFSHGYVSTGSVRLGGMLANPLLFVKFALIFVGGGLTPGRPLPAALLGLAGAGLLAVRLAMLGATAARDLAWRRTGEAKANLALVLYAALVAGAAILSGLGRAPQGLLQAMSSRYALASLSFWAVLIVAWLIEPQPRPPTIAAAARTATWIGAGLLAMMVAVGQPGLFPFASSLKADRVNGMIAYQLGVRRDPAVQAIYPVAETLAAGALDGRFREMMARRKGLYGEDWPWRFGQPLSGWAKPSLRGCQGAVQARRELVGEARPLAELRGWAATGGGAAADLVAVTDGSGKVVGFGVSGHPPQGRGWTAYAQAAPGQSLQVFALNLGAAAAACRMPLPNAP